MIDCEELTCKIICYENELHTFNRCSGTTLWIVRYIVKTLKEEGPTWDVGRYC